MVRAACVVRGCGREVVARGVCNSHYRELRIASNLASGRICRNDGCGGGEYAGGLCRSCHANFLYHCPTGSPDGRCKLDAGHVGVILAELERGVSQQTLAHRFGVSRSLIGQIKRGDIWRFIPRPSIAAFTAEVRG